MYRFILPTARRGLQRPWHALTGLFVTLAGWSCVAASADDSADWRTGSAYQLALRQPVRVYWPDSPIRDALMRLSEEQNVAIFLDRRVDPGKRVDFRPKELAPLADLLKNLAASQNLGVASVGSAVYIGPQATAAKIPALLKMRREELRKVPRTAAQQLAKRHTLRWQVLTTPQELLARLEQEYGVRIAAKELVPHDLWPAANLPELSFSEQLTLILAGFELTYEIGNEGVKLTPIPERMTLVKEDGTRVVRRTTSPPETRYTLTVENQPVGSLMQALVARLDLKLTIDPAAQQSISKLVSFQVKEATRDQLLRAALQPAGLDFRLEGTTVVVIRSP